ncbi:MAG: hypothetical protein OIF57_00635 [Marinobacterium sp.]|nr:hypothetical protein [Marinobacterium sp.]
MSGNQKKPRKVCKRCLITRIAMVMAALVALFIWQGLSGFMG